MMLMRNLDLREKRCRGADDSFNPRICEQRNRCQRHRQLDYDRQLGLPAEVQALVSVMLYPRVGGHQCHFFIDAEVV